MNIEKRARELCDMWLQDPRVAEELAPWIAAALQAAEAAGREKGIEEAEKAGEAAHRGLLASKYTWEQANGAEVVLLAIRLLEKPDGR
jgi:hypothetical protein